MSLTHTVTVFIEIQAPGLDYVIPCWTIIRNCELKYTFRRKCYTWNCKQFCYVICNFIRIFLGNILRSKFYGTVLFKYSSRNIMAESVDDNVISERFVTICICFLIYCFKIKQEQLSTPTFFQFPDVRVFLLEKFAQSPC